MGSNKTLQLKLRHASLRKMNRPVPHWYRIKTHNAIRWNNKRRHWKRSKIGL
ncbi:60S ribosomal protein L39 [Carpediemonas membranifera]|uniref:60S ribosomal protein L39 n=1 Tax=Carpediemonas membranifera TaxID=201153 RepID=A0A8J6ATH3_9EUKA|nr:60S ribosomal protein L39 [Carpediemonas membranifera]KAG9392903.1 60S ribosomal protein L39 [Carpediemonas membranifera]|eukprot:KAG9391080.1 60S ribosomal protein L39 [Carpediemonas membranifera]